MPASTRLAMRHETASREIPNRATRVANCGLSLTTPIHPVVKSAGCKASDFRKVSSAQSTFGRSGSATQEMSLAKLGSRPRPCLPSAFAEDRRSAVALRQTGPSVPYRSARLPGRAPCDRVCPARACGADGPPQKILVLFLTFFEIHAMLVLSIDHLGGGTESEAGMEGTGRVRTSCGSTPLAG